MWSDLNFLFFIFYFLFFIFYLNSSNILYLILNSELIWIIFYLICIYLGFFFDNINLISLTLFFLIFSAIELSIIFILITFQKHLLKTLNLFNFNNNFFFFLIRYQHRLTNFKYKWNNFK